MKKVYVRWSAAEVHPMTFVKWKRRLYPKDYTGKRDPGWWGVGAVVWSKWMFDYSSELRKLSRREHLPIKHYWLAPHTELYFTYQGAQTGLGKKIKRPTIRHYQKLLKRRN